MVRSLSYRPRHAGVGRADMKSSVQGDLSTKAGVEKIVQTLSESEHVVRIVTYLSLSQLTVSRQVDVLINCAGVVAPWKNPISDHDDRELNRGLLRTPL
jgi:NAD(P)-dependent dehydrogenase (short-subunit alcohol dehydrogenase family)